MQFVLCAAVERKWETIHLQGSGHDYQLASQQLMCTQNPIHTTTTLNARRVPALLEYNPLTN